MKVSFTALTVVAAGLLLLAASCQQTNKGESRSKWHLKSPPGTAAGYGTSPLDTSERKETPTVFPTDDSGHGEVTPTSSDPAPGDSGPASSTPALKIKPPPSAAGYGSPFLDIDQQKETPIVSPTNGSGHGETPPATSEPVSRHPASMGSGPTSSWKIIPPPSAAGYGK